MCDPVSIAGLVLSAGSAVAGQMASSQAASARNDVMAAERIRQQGFDRETTALNDASQKRYEGFQSQQDQKATQLGDYFAGQQADAAAAANAGTAALSVPQSSSNLTVQNEAQERGDARKSTNQQAKARGNLRAFGDVLGSTNLLQARDAIQIGQIGGFKKGSSGVTSFELEDANNAGSGMKMFGDLLGLAGGAATSYGLKGSYVGSTLGAGASSVANSGIAAARAADRASVPGYSAASGVRRLGV